MKSSATADRCNAVLYISVFAPIRFVRMPFRLQSFGNPYYAQHGMMVEPRLFCNTTRICSDVAYVIILAAVSA